MTVHIDPLIKVADAQSWNDGVLIFDQETHCIVGGVSLVRTLAT
ncbi:MULTISPECIES: hypothetical protein [unclassified Bradyrhizobium]